MTSLLATISGLPVAAQTYPTKPVRIVAPYAPGGTLDVVTRMISQRLTETLGQQFVVDNRSGAGGIIGSDLVAKSPPDGYTIVMGNVSTHAINVSLYPKHPFDPVKDFSPITQTVLLQMALVVHPSLPVTSVKQLIALAKARPGSLNYASGGIGTSQHLAAELFKSMTSTDMRHVPYRGNAPAIVDLLGGHVVLIFDNLASVLPHIKSNRLRAIASTSARRTALMPELPTVAESGLTGYEVIGWHGLFAPAGTPREIVHRLSTEVARMLATSDMRNQLSSQGVEPVGSTPEQFAAFQKSEMIKWAKVIKISGAKAE